MPSIAHAQSVPFAGFTNGCFGVACTPVSSNVFQTATFGGLTFENSTFDGTTLGGFAAVGNVSNGVGNREDDNLGAFYLGSQFEVYTGTVFKLLVTFTAPGSAMQTFLAALQGSVLPGKFGGVFIDFDNTPQTFSYVNGGTSGTVSLSINDVSITAPATGGTTGIAVSGNLFATAATVTPEPTSLLLLGTGVLAIGGLARRRRAATA